MICSDVAEHLRSISPWVNWEHTADTFKAGDPDRDVRTIAVAWKANWASLREAVARGADLFISHESISVNAPNGTMDPEVAFALPSEQPKFEWLAETGLVVYRSHDVWDRVPKEGIRDSWYAGLELGGTIIADEYPFYVTEIEPTAVGAIARHVAAKVAPLGQNGILLSGNADKQITRLATATGASPNVLKMIALGGEAGVISEDYYVHVRMGEHARELDFPTILVNHGVSEEWGVASLARYLARVFPDLTVFHIPQRCAYTVVTADT